MFTKSLFAAALAAIGVSAFGFDQPAYDATYTTNGITYAQRGGLGVKDFVVTNIDAGAVGKVKSVNGRVGDVVLDAAAVNALPDGKDELVSNENFKEAVATVSPPVELPEKWAFANVTNANGETVNASDVGALGNSGSQTLNQSYGGLSVNFDSKGTLYTGQYAPSRWSITKEVNDQYYYVQFFGFSGTNYPSFNLFDGESDFYIRLPRKEGTLALKGDIPKSFATSSITNANGTAIDDDGKLTYGKIRDKGGCETHGIAAINGDNEVYITTDGLSTVDDSGYSPYQGLCVKDSSSGWSDFSVDAIHFCPKGYGQMYYYYFPHDSGTIALEGWRSLSGMLDNSDANALATHLTFSNAVLAVGLNIDTNSVAVLNEIAETFGGFPLGAGETATTVGGLLAALAAAVAMLNKRSMKYDAEKDRYYTER